MIPKYNERYEADQTPSRTVVERYRAVFREDDHDASIAVIHYRGGGEEFRLGREYCESDDPGDRAVGADVLSQLGWADQTFQEESVAILISMLEDRESEVVANAASALGHRNDASAIPALLKLTEHPDEDVRFGVMAGLSAHEDPRAVAALIGFSTDEDRDVRNWAVFGLGTQIEFDSPELRAALTKALQDVDHEIRGEGLRGLAQRKDPSVVAALLDEWEGDTVSILSLEAAEEVGDPKLLPSLQGFAGELDMEDDEYFKKQLDAAIAACTPVVG